MYATQFTYLTATLFLTLFSLSTVTAQPRGIKIDESTDAFEGATTVLMDGNKVKVEGLTESALAKGVLSLMSGDVQVSVIKTELNLEKYHREGAAPEYAIIVSVDVRDDANFNIGTGESLVLLVDGERMGFSTSGEFNKEYRDYYGNSATNARYSVTAADLETIIAAEEVRFRIVQGGYMDRAEQTRDKQASTFEGRFSDRNFAAWRYFFGEYLAK